MFEDYSRNRRFVSWLESVAKGARPGYPEPEAFTDDASSFLARFDRMRSDQRTLDKCYRELLTGIGELAEVSPQAPPAEVLDALNRKFRAAEEAGARQIAEHETALETFREERDAARAELEATQAKLAEARSELQRQQRKLDPVLRYAYNLRRLVQRIHARGELTPSIRRYIEELLEAGGASVNGSAAHTTKPQTANSTSTIS